MRNIGTLELVMFIDTLELSRPANRASQPHFLVLAGARSEARGQEVKSQRFALRPLAVSLPLGSSFLTKKWWVGLLRLVIFFSDKYMSDVGPLWIKLEIKHINGNIESLWGKQCMKGEWRMDTFFHCQL